MEEDLHLDFALSTAVLSVREGCIVVNIWRQVFDRGIITCRCPIHKIGKRRRLSFTAKADLAIACKEGCEVPWLAWKWSGEWPAHIQVERFSRVELEPVRSPVVTITEVHGVRLGWDSNGLLRMHSRGRHDGESPWWSFWSLFISWAHICSLWCAFSLNEVGVVLVTREVDCCCELAGGAEEDPLVHDSVICFDYNLTESWLAFKWFWSELKYFNFREKFKF